MKEANGRLFDKLRAASETHQGDRVARWIETVSRDEKAVLQQAQFHIDRALQITDASAIFLARFKTDLFVITKGFSKLVGDQLVTSGVNAGWFTAAVSELPIGLNASVTNEDLEEVVFLPAEPSGVAGVSYLFDDIAPLFEAFELYVVPDDSPLLLDNVGDRVALYIASSTETRSRLNFRETTIERFREASLSSARNLPHLLLTRAFFESRWDQAFLDVYRCIEQLFPLARVRRLEHQIFGSASSSLRLHELAEYTESILGWRAKEDDALSELLASLEESLRTEICWYCDLNPAQENAISKAAERLYKMRNRAVHYRPLHTSEPEPSDDEWESATTWLLRAVCSLYSTLGPELRPTPALPI